MQQVGRHIFGDPAAHKFNGAVEGLALAVIPHHMQVAGSSGLLEIEAVVTLCIKDWIKLQSVLSHVATNGSIPSRINHQPPQRPV